MLWLRCGTILAITLAGCSQGETEKARADSLQAVLQARDDSTRAQVSRDSVGRVGDSIRAVEAERNKLVRVDLVNTTGVDIPSQDFRDYGFTLPLDARSCMLMGRVEAIAGGNKDIAVMVMSDDDFINWKNNARGEGKALFSEGPQSVVSVQYPFVVPGRYHLVISNKFSVFTSKTVKGEAAVTCLGAAAQPD